MNSPALSSETGASPSPTRNVRGASQARTSSPGYDHRSGDHVAVIFHSPRLVEIVPRTAAEWRAIEDAERRASRERAYREKACVSCTPDAPMRHRRRSKRNRRHRG